jgi:hypothetical protein
MLQLLTAVNGTKEERRRRLRPGISSGQFRLVVLVSFKGAAAAARTR